MAGRPEDRLGQPGLWAYGISGDLPILLTTIGHSRDIDLVREALLAHTYWRLHGLKVDLIILNEEAGSYEQSLHEELKKLMLGAFKRVRNEAKSRKITNRLAALSLGVQKVAVEKSKRGLYP